MSIGERVRKAREAKGLTQVELGTLLGVKAAAVSKLETENWGSRGPSASRLERVAAALGLPDAVSLLRDPPKKASSSTGGGSKRRGGSARRSVS